MANRTGVGRSIAPDPQNREANDFYSTPPEAVRALLSVERFHGTTILEPACGTGNISKVLEVAGYKVVSSDLIDRGYGTGGVDFLKSKKAYPNVVTNPPFKRAQEFIEHALVLTEPYKGMVAMFLKLTFLESVKRGPVLDTFTPRALYPFMDRVTTLRGGLAESGGGGGMVAFGWFVWDHRWKGMMMIPCRLNSGDFVEKAKP